MTPHRADGSRLCLSCGLCCQGVLHDWAKIEEGEIGLAERLELRTVRRPQGHVFALPCHLHREEGCTVYDQRPSSCRGYRCKLLSSHLAGEITWEESLRRVDQVKQLVAAIRSRLGAPLAGASIWQQLREAGDGTNPALRLDVASLLALCRHHFQDEGKIEA